MVSEFRKSLERIWKPKCSNLANPTRIRFTIGYAAASLAIFRPGCQIRLIQVKLPGGSADVELSTRYLDGWGPVEQTLVMDAIGSAQDPVGAKPALLQTLSE